jgi:hypothetical protein
LQDIGDGLLSLLHYPERQQLVAVTSSGSAMILGNNSNSTGSGAAAAEWSVLMKMKFAGVSGNAKLQVKNVNRMPTGALAASHTSVHAAALRVRNCEYHAHSLIRHTLWTVGCNSTMMACLSIATSVLYVAGLLGRATYAGNCHRPG